MLEIVLAADGEIRIGRLNVGTATFEHGESLASMSSVDSAIANRVYSASIVYIYTHLRVQGWLVSPADDFRRAIPMPAAAFARFAESFYNSYAVPGGTKSAWRRRRGDTIDNLDRGNSRRHGSQSASICVRDSSRLLAALAGDRRRC